LNKEIKIGDRVKLIGVPDWLIHDLPEEEKLEILAQIGSIMTVEDIDDIHELFWIGFGYTTEDEENAYYTGHSFSVSKNVWFRLILFRYAAGLYSRRRVSCGQCSNPIKMRNPSHESHASQSGANHAEDAGRDTRAA
jgi:hypothetical protein